MNIIRRAYDWVLHWAHTVYAVPALFIISFAESSFFPIPPDILLIAMCLARKERSLFYAGVCSLASVLGGALGYFIGSVFWVSLSNVFFSYVPGFTPESFESMRVGYEAYSFWLVFTAGFTPIPFKLITITAGIFSINLPIFLLASFISRSARFFLFAVLIFYYGDKVNNFINKYFNLVTVFLLVLIVGLYFLLRSI